MASTERETILNRGNFLNRIGVARREMWIARCVAVVAICVAVVGWCRPMNKIIISSLINNDCMQYAETMCNE